MPGFRVGFAISNSTTIQTLKKVHQYLNVCQPQFIQRGIGKYLLEGGYLDYFHKTRAHYDGLRSIFKESTKIVGISSSPADGAFYHFVEIPERFESDFDFSLKLIESIGVYTIPGSVFGQAYNRYIRVSLGNMSIDSLTQCIEKFTSQWE